MVWWVPLAAAAISTAPALLGGGGGGGAGRGPSIAQPKSQAQQTVFSPFEVTRNEGISPLVWGIIAVAGLGFVYLTRRRR